MAISSNIVTIVSPLEDSEKSGGADALGEWRKNTGRLTHLGAVRHFWKNPRASAGRMLTMEMVLGTMTV